MSSPPQGPSPDGYPPSGYPAQPGYPPQPGYVPQQGSYVPQQGSYPPGGYPQPRSGNGYAIAALILGILALLSSWTVFGGVVFGVAALILGVIGWRKARSGASGLGLSVTGVVLGLFGVLIAAALVIFGIGVFRQIGGSDYVSCINDAAGSQSAIERCASEFQQNVDDRFGPGIVVPTP